jgi:hypothetical protein
MQEISLPADCQFLRTQLLSTVYYDVNPSLIPLLTGKGVSAFDPSRQLPYAVCIPHFSF